MESINLEDWPQLADFMAYAFSLQLRVWLFGSALTNRTPRDLDLLVIYTKRETVLTLRRQRWWADLDPPLDIIAMTDDEERHYRFIELCRAVELRRNMSQHGPVADG